ncbi:hypothetical protein [Streptomyces sp. WMMB 322]|uniref:hypothetical protein n=1 Tax=Streptomyces sp. WMMB 322 TaxID=1286821 RepID=UPI0006E230F0|nr:hypothetical protein [Streptomyces sp. WMMB 322]SCK56275.1 hypothetical protein H180DRAFT_05220 [Streptomyces sp. WMMB 322]
MDARQARRTRLLAAATATVALSVALSGCVTVHGENAVIPAVSKTEARKVLKEFNATSNKANSSHDPELNSTIETGALGAIDGAGLKSRKKLAPKGNPGYKPLRLSDPRFLIPKQAGWPKFFVADTRSNRTADGRWFLVFQRDDAESDWRASYLAVLQDSEIPEFVTGKGGHVKPVPGGPRSQLTVAPDRMSDSYVSYLREGTGDFAPGEHTSKRREQRQKSANRPGKRTEFADVPAKAPQYAAFGLRTRDGGALVFFSSQHHTKETYAKGYKPPVKDPLVKALMTGTPRQAVTYVRVSEQAVKVPARKDGGKVEFLNRIDGLTAVKGE